MDGKHKGCCEDSGLSIPSGSQGRAPGGPSDHGVSDPSPPEEQELLPSAHPADIVNELFAIVLKKQRLHRFPLIFTYCSVLC